ncbi:carbohydrate binding family 9 domain-containing protein [bacterium]|nr:carbohydrate binding family 9 domain-containing protein [bacterium]
MKLISFILLNAVFLSLSLFAEDSIQIPPRITNPPRIDGNLDEEVWKGALVVSDFKQRLPREGSTPTEQTDMLILYTERSLFLGFRAYDSQPQKIVATVMKRDDFDLVQNDQLAFAIDSYNDGRNGYWFSTNPLGARVDAQFANEGDLWEPNWNGIWECKSQITDQGWIAEVEVPFSTLRFHKASINIMGINFFRRIIRTNEQIFAPLIPLQLSNGTPNVSAARKYRFEAIQSGDHLFVKPYALSGFSAETGNTEAEKDAGLDIRYQLTNNLISNFSANMDFAEADVDDRQVNLTRFRLFFPEKREFFLESAGNFQFGIPGETEIFFSRRIGLSEDGTETVPILFGAKLTGKINRLDIGALNVQTRSDSGFPADNFAVLRLKAGISCRSYIGSILTNRSTDGLSSKQTLGVDINIHLWNEIFLTGFATGNHSSQDGMSFSDSTAFDLNLSRSGERTSFRIRYSDIDAGFDPAIGFVQRPDTRRLSGNLFLPYYTKSGPLLSLTPGYELIREEDHAGTQTLLFHEASIKALFQSEDQFRFFASRNEELVPVEFPIFRTITVPAGNYLDTRFGMEISTKPGRNISGTLSVSHGGFYDGSRLELSPSILWKISEHLTVSQNFVSNFVGLDQEDFHIYLSRTRISYSLNTSLSSSAVLQYDNSSQEFGLNWRAGYLFKEGTELFIVYNEIMDRATYTDLPVRRDRSLLIKFTYLLRI